MAKRYVVAPGRQVIGEGNIAYPGGAEVPYDKSLLEVGAIVEAASTEPAKETPAVDPTNPAGLVEGDETITNPLDHLSAEDAIALIEMTSDRTELADYAESEKNGKNRKSVVGAANKQLASLN